jgi:hypothetical protein
MVGLERITLRNKINYVILKLILHIPCLLGGDGLRHKRLIISDIGITPLRLTRLSLNQTKSTVILESSFTSVKGNLLCNVVPIQVNRRHVVQNLYNRVHVCLI